jgi:hypothetical protein
MLIQSEIGIGIHPVLVNIESFYFFILTHPDTYCFLEREYDDKGG